MDTNLREIYNMLTTDAHRKDERNLLLREIVLLTAENAENTEVVRR